MAESVGKGPNGLGSRGSTSGIAQAVQARANDVEKASRWMKAPAGLHSTHSRNEGASPHFDAIRNPGSNPSRGSGQDRFISPAATVATGSDTAFRTPARNRTSRSAEKARTDLEQAGTNGSRPEVVSSRSTVSARYKVGQRGSVSADKFRATRSYSGGPRSGRSCSGPQLTCEWCRQPLTPRNQSGRKRVYCSQSCRQRAYQSRKRSRQLGLREGELVVSSVLLARMNRRLHALEMALDDVEAADLHTSDERVYRLCEAARRLRRLVVGPPTR